MTEKRGCEYCLNYVYDDEYGENICEADMDMDEIGRFSQNSYEACPYFRVNNEYKIVEKQN